MKTWPSSFLQEQTDESWWPCRHTLRKTLPGNDEEEEVMLVSSRLFPAARPLTRCGAPPQRSELIGSQLRLHSDQSESGSVMHRAMKAEMRSTMSSCKGSRRREESACLCRPAVRTKKPLAPRIPGPDANLVRFWENMKFVQGLDLLVTPYPNRESPAEGFTSSEWANRWNLK